MENEFYIEFECNAINGTLFNAEKYEIRLGDFKTIVDYKTFLSITAWFLGKKMVQCYRLKMY